MNSIVKASTCTASPQAEAPESSIEDLSRRQLVWRGGASLKIDSRATGFELLDQKLGGGLPASGVIDVQSLLGIGELRLLLPLLAQPEMHQQEQKRLCSFITPPAELYAEALTELGLPVSQVLVIKPQKPSEALWAAEQCLKSGACRAVLLWHQKMTLHQARRLQLASQEGRAQLFLMRSAKTNADPLPVSLSLRLSGQARGLTISIPKRRGGWPVAEFTLDLQSQWPQLTLPPQTTSPLPVPESQAV